MRSSAQYRALTGGTWSSSVAATTGSRPPPTWPAPAVGCWCWSGPSRSAVRPCRRPCAPPGRRSRASTRGCRATPTWSACCPGEIVDDLGLDVRLARRRVSSYTPDPGDPAAGCWSPTTRTPPVARSPESARPATTPAGPRCTPARDAGAGGVPDADRPAAHPRASCGRRVGDDAPVDGAGRAAARGDDHRALRSDLVRGVVATDALIGTFARARRPVAAPRTAASSTT